MLLRHALPTRGLVIAGVVAVGLVLAIPLITAGQGTVLEIDAERDITIVGVDPSDLSGTDVATGDLNDDGVIDIVIGAHFADPPLRTDAGETYVLFGPRGAGTLDLATDADATFIGVETSDFSGVAVAVGDLNNDGADDLVIGAWQADPPGRSAAGETSWSSGRWQPGRRSCPLWRTSLCKGSTSPTSQAGTSRPATSTPTA